MAYFLSKNSMKRLENVHPELIFILKESIKYSPIDFGVTESGGVRSAQEQHEMYMNPDIKTHADGYKVLSKHQVPNGQRYGLAVDVFVWLNGGVSWHNTHFGIVGGVIMSTASRLKRSGEVGIQLKWGATFGSKMFHGWDAGHFEIER